MNQPPHLTTPLIFTVLERLPLRLKQYLNVNEYWPTGVSNDVTVKIFCQLPNTYMAVMYYQKKKVKIQTKVNNLSKNIILYLNINSLLLI